MNREAARMMFRRGRITEAMPLFREGGRADGHRLAQCRRCCMTCYHQHDDDETAALESRMTTLDRAELALAKDPTNGAAISAAGAGACACSAKTTALTNGSNAALLLDPDNLSMRYNLACALISRFRRRRRMRWICSSRSSSGSTSADAHQARSKPIRTSTSLRDHPRFMEMLARRKAAARDAPRPSRRCVLRRSAT